MPGGEGGCWCKSGDGLVCTCKQRSEPGAPLAVINLAQIFPDSVAVEHRSLQFIHLMGFYETFYSNSLPLFGEML